MKPLLFIAQLIIVIVAIVYPSSIIAQQIVQGVATNVYDGDTFTLVDDELEMRIRVVGIDAPEFKQAFGEEARDYARKLIDGKTVTVYLEPGETYGRKLGIVITEDGKHFNYEMVANGYAWFYNSYSDDKYLEAAFKEAREKKFGLWSQNDPKAPWIWRREN